MDLLEGLPKNFPMPKQLSGPPPSSVERGPSEAQINLFTAFVNLGTEVLKHSN